MTDTADTAQVARRVRHQAIRGKVAGEPAEAAEAEAAEKASALDVPMHLRIDRELDQQLRQRARDEQIPTSALVRRLLRAGHAGVLRDVPGRGRGTSRAGRLRRVPEPRRELKCPAAVRRRQ